MNQVVDPDANDLASDAPEKGDRLKPTVWLALILAAYLVITLAYGVINPLFESPDEHMHYFTMQYLVDNGRLPAVAPGNEYDQWMGQEAAQPPLYYLLGSALIAPLNPVEPECGTMAERIHGDGRCQFAQQHQPFCSQWWRLFSLAGICAGRAFTAWIVDSPWAGNSAFSLWRGSNPVAYQAVSRAVGHITRRFLAPI